MHNIRTLILLFLFNTLSGFQIFAQQAILPSGADASGLGGSVSYSIGQLDYINFRSDSGAISLGVQQPLVVNMVSIDDPEEALNVSAFPNPVNTTVNLKLEKDLLITSKDILSYHLYDISGKLLKKKKINDVLTAISMKEFESGMYVLHVTLNNTEVRSFKIIKTN